MLRTTLLRVGLVSCVLAGTTVGAATFVVDTTLDSAAAAHQACTAAPNDCSLRGAVLRANASPGRDRIDLQAGATYVLSLGVAGEDAALEGDLDVTEDLVLAGNGATIDAGGIDRALHVVSGNLKVQGAVLRNGDASSGASSGGGAIRSEAGTVRLVGVTLEDNVGSLGGAVRQIGGSTVLENATLRNNSADGSGGAVYVDAGDLVVESSSFLTNESINDGGAVAFRGSTLTVTGGLFEDNRRLSTDIWGDGGAIALGTGSAVLTGTEFRANVTEYSLGQAARGGAIAADSGTDLTATDCLFEDNVSGYHGGAIYSEGTVTLTEVVVLRNESNFDGGGVALIATVSKFEGVTFEGNLGRFGGGVYAENDLSGGSFVDIQDGLFIDNEASTGGAVYHRGSAESALAELFLDEVAFHWNFATGEGGAALWNQGGLAVAVLQDLTVVNNQGTGVNTRGAFGNFQDSSGSPVLELRRSLFAENVMNGDGGGLYNSGHSFVYATELVHNEADDGGGIFSEGGESLLVFNRSLVADNVAADDGGGLFLQGIGSPTDEAVVAINNSTISRNLAGGLGGGIVVAVNNTYPAPATARVFNATVFNNVDNGGAGDGIVVDQGDLFIWNSIVANPGNPECLTLAGGSIISGGYNIDDGNTCGFAAVGDQTFTAPMLLALLDNGGATRTHETAALSPAVDAANPAGCVADRDGDGVIDPNTLDFDQRLYARDALCDVGAYEQAP